MKRHTGTTPKEISVFVNSVANSKKSASQIKAEVPASTTIDIQPSPETAADINIEPFEFVAVDVKTEPEMEEADHENSYKCRCYDDKYTKA